jgi:hypothetical protein
MMPLEDSNMPRNSINEIIKQFDQLSPEERQQLIKTLEQRQSNGNAESDRSLLAAFQERGMIGSIKGMPADWSTNPDYLNGFGNSAHAQ